MMLLLVSLFCILMKDKFMIFYHQLQELSMSLSSLSFKLVKVFDVDYEKPHAVNEKYIIIIT